MKEALDGLAGAASNGGPPSASDGLRTTSEGEALAVAALSAVGGIVGVVFVVDCDQKRIVWTSEAQATERRLRPNDVERSIVRLAEKFGAGDVAGGPLPSAQYVPEGTVVSAVSVKTGPERPHRRLYAVQVLFGPKRKRALPKLTSREREIAHLLCAGYTPANIGARVGIATSTVRTYVRRIYAKLRVFSRVELVRTLFDEGGPHGLSGIDSQDDEAFEVSHPDG